MPMRERKTWFSWARLFRYSSTSNSPSGRSGWPGSGDRASGPQRIEAGTAASASASSDSKPNDPSMSPISAGSGPMCRWAKVSDGDSGGGSESGAAGAAGAL